MGVGLALLGYGVPGLLLGPFIGRMADRQGRGRLLPLGLLLGSLAAAALILDAPLLPAALAVTVLSLGYDMTQPLLAGIVTALGGKRPGQAMGLNVCLLFVGFGVGSLLFGWALRYDFGLPWRCSRPRNWRLPSPQSASSEQRLGQPRKPEDNVSPCLTPFKS